MVCKLQQMLNICSDFAIEYDVKFNCAKFVVLWIGPRFNAGSRIRAVMCFIRGSYFK